MFDFWIMQLAGQNVASCRNTSSRGTICRGGGGAARGSDTGDGFLRIKREDAAEPWGHSQQPPIPPEPRRIPWNGEVKCRQNMVGKDKSQPPSNTEEPGLPRARPQREMGEMRAPAPVPSPLHAVLAGHSLGPPCRRGRLGTTARRGCPQTQPRV